MSMISLAAAPDAEAPFTNSPFNTLLLWCCAGLVASFGLTAHGIDLGLGLI